ncbi:hypothetical protein B566_EDAN013793 [Ephemera danica]|nr:hypothetical protein B566_EDAN013793 [Ephemera danica]
MFVIDGRRGSSTLSMSNEDDDCVLEEDIDDAYDLANEDEDALLAGDEGTQGNDWRDDNFEEGRQEDILVISPTDALLGEEEEDLRVGLQNKANKHGWDTEEEEKAEESEEEEEEEDTEGRARFRQERVIQAPPRTQRQSIPDTLENVQVPVERTQFSGRGMGNRQGRWPRGARGHRGGRMNPGMQRMPPMQHQQAYQQQQNPPHLMQQKPQLQQQRQQQQQQMQRQLQSPQQQMRVAPFQHQELNRTQIEPKVVPLKNSSQKILVNPHFKGRRPNGPDLSWLPQQMSGDYSTPQTQHAGYQPPQQQPQPLPPTPIETWSVDAQFNQYQGPPTPHQLPPQHLGPPPNMNYPMRTHVPPPQQQPPIPTITEAWNAGPSHPQEYYHQPPEYQQHQPPTLPPMIPQPQRQPTPPNFGNRPPQYEAQQPRFNFPQQQPQYQPPPPVYHSEPDYSVPPPNFQGVNNYPPAEPLHPAENAETWDSSGYNQDYYQRTEIQPLMHPPYPSVPHTRPVAPPRGLPAGRRQGSPMRGGPVRRGMPPAGRGVGPLMRPTLMGQPRQISPMQGRNNMQKTTPMAAVPAQIQGRRNVLPIQNAGVVKIIQQRPLQKLGMPGEMKRPATAASKYTGSPQKQPRLEVPKMKYLVPLLLMMQFTVHAQYQGLPSSGGSIQSGGRPGYITPRPVTTRPGATSRPAGTERPVGTPSRPGATIGAQRMQEIYSWNTMDFNYPSEAARQEAINSGAFNAVNITSLPAVVEAAGSRVFLTIPRWLPGVPATLSTIPYPSDTRSPRLTPYPNWEFNRQGNCNGLTSVFRVKADECNRLWVLDNGLVNNFNTAETLCPPQVYVFDLSTDQVIHRFILPNQAAVANAESDVPAEEEDEEMREYRKRIEEQKRMREAILKRKEIARRQAALKKQQEMGTSEEGVELEPVSTIATLVLAARGRGRGGMVQPLVTKRKVVSQNIGALATQGATPTGTPGMTRLVNSQNVGVAANKQPPQVTKQGFNVQRGRGILVRGVVSRGRIAAGAATRGLVSQKIVRTFQQPANASHQATRGITRGAGVVARGTGRKVIFGGNTAPIQRDPEDKIIPDHKMRVVLVENLAVSVTKEKLMKLKGDLSLMSVIRQENLYVTIEVEYPRGQCGSPRDAFIYLADSDTFGLIVADMSSGPVNTQPRTLYYNVLNNFRQSWVQTSVLRNESLSLNSPQSYQTGTGVRTSQCGDTAIDQRGVMFLGLLGEQTVACWNTRSPYQSSNIITLARDDETLQFPVSIQVDTSDRLWVMSTKFQRFAVETITPGETNFRVFMAPASEIVRGTACDTRQMTKMRNVCVLTILSVLVFPQYSSAQCVGNRNERPQPSAYVFSHQKQLQEVYNWAQFDFQYPNDVARQEAIESGSFIPVNSSAPASLEVYGNRVFISLPRWKNGVPATLSTVPFPSDTPSPLLSPYPDWEANRQGNCDGLTSVYRMQVDKCNRLWVLDTGTVNSFVNAENICPVQIVVFDLLTDEIIYRYRLPDYPNCNCGTPRDAFVYISDTVGYQLIVVDAAAERAWSVRDKTMFPSPEGGTFNVGGETFELMDGVMGLALSPESSPDRWLFYSSMSGFTQRAVRTATLRNQSIATQSPTAFQTSRYARNSQAGDSAMDQNGVLFFGLLSDQSVACWNTRKNFERKNIVKLAKNDELLQFPVAVVVDQISRLWVFATRFHSFFLGTQIPTETNYRIFMAPSTTALVRGTACDINQRNVVPYADYDFYDLSSNYL